MIKEEDHICISCNHRKPNNPCQLDIATCPIHEFNSQLLKKSVGIMRQALVLLESVVTKNISLDVAIAHLKGAIEIEELG